MATSSTSARVSPAACSVAGKPSPSNKSNVQIAIMGANPFLPIQCLRATRVSHGARQCATYAYCSAVQKCQEPFSSIMILDHAGGLVVDINPSLSPACFRCYVDLRLACRQA